MMGRMTGRLLTYSEYLRARYGAPAYRVSVDAGFSCPNRGPDRSRPGCLYCDEHGSRAPYQGPAGDLPDGLPARLQDVRRQIAQAKAFLQRRYGAEHFLLYFQAFSATHAPVPELRRLYDEALACGPFRELLVSTRPDCIDPARAELLASYRTRGLEVWVELGLQSASDETLQRIRRGHTAAQFAAAFRLLRERGLKLAVHLIFGLPGEGLARILETVRFTAGLDPDGVKIHNLHVPRGSPLAAELAAGELAVPCAGRHLDYVVRALELLPPRTVIMRLACDTPRERLAAPRVFLPKAAFHQAVRRELERRDTRQGRLWVPLSGPGGGASAPPGR